MLSKCKSFGQNKNPHYVSAWYANKVEIYQEVLGRAEQLATELQQQISKAVPEAQDLYNRLVIVAGEVTDEKRAQFLATAEGTNAPSLNISRELSASLLDIPSHKRKLKAPRCFRKIVDSTKGDVVFITDIAFLFEPSLQMNPLKIFQNISKDLIVVVLWDGDTDGNSLEYAETGHPEHRSYSIDEAGIVINANQNQKAEDI